MRKSVYRAPLLALSFGILAFAQAGPPTKVGIIHIQNAIGRTNDGQKAGDELKAKFAPKQSDVDRRQQELSQLEQQYRSGVNTMSDEARTKLARDIEQKRKLLQRDMDDAQQELEQEQNRILQELGQKMMVVIDKYASDRGFAMILDVSSPQSPVLYASNAIDITADIVDLYNKGAAVTAAPSTTTRPPAATPKPAAAPKK